MLKAVDQLLLFVSNTHDSVKFYQQLGFKVLSDEDDFAEVELNGFEIHLHDKTKVQFDKDANIEPKGAGVFLYLQTDQIDNYHQDLIGKGLTPSSEPKDWPWGKREFAIKDPDGYKLIIYQKL